MEFKFEFPSSLLPFMHIIRQISCSIARTRCVPLQNVARNGLIWSKPLQTWWPNYHRQLLFMQEALSHSPRGRSASSRQWRKGCGTTGPLSISPGCLPTHRRRRHGILCCARLWILNTHTTHTAGEITFWNSRHVQPRSSFIVNYNAGGIK